MFKDKPFSLGNSPRTDSCTVLEQDAAFEGKLTFDGTVQILGDFKGEIFSPGTLIIGESAQVSGKIEVGMLQIAGKVSGSIQVKERLELLAKARVTADIATAALVVEQGAQFQGNCQMGLVAPEPVYSSSERYQSAGEEGRAEEAIELFQ